MKHVFIATPAHSGDVVCEYVQSLLGTQLLMLQNGIAVTHSFCIGDALVHDARNRLVSWFMSSPADTLLFIDADIAWDPKDALTLVQSPHGVIGGAYRQKRDDEELYNVAGIQAGPTNLLECDYIGTGFLKIGRKAIERMYAGYPETRYGGQGGEECYGLFEAPIGGGRIVGEDAMFCRRWRETGGKVFLDPDMTLHHIGRRAYSGNFAQLAARAGKAA